jgi:hypothetical protein
MLKKINALLICAVMLLMSAPSQSIAQTIEQRATDAQAKPRRDLKTAIAEVTAKSRANTVMPAGLKRFEREGPQNTTKNYGGLTKKEKILIYSIVAGMVVLAVVLGIKTGKGGHAFCDTDPTDPDCLGSFP